MEMRPKMKLESTGNADSKRIVDADGEVIAMCERYTSGFWAVHCAKTHNKISSAHHKTPRAAMR